MAHEVHPSYFLNISSTFFSLVRLNTNVNETSNYKRTTLDTSYDSRNSIQFNLIQYSTTITNATMSSCYSYLLCWRPTPPGHPMTLYFPLNASEESVACDSSFSFSLVDRLRIHPCRPTRCPNFDVFSCEKPHIHIQYILP